MSKSRKALLATYAAAYEAIPLECVCCACGLPAPREQFERHHPAGRRKAAFLFTVQVHSHCHLRIHADPRWAEDHGLLWRGRNSREFTVEAAEQLIARQPFPATYAIAIWQDFSQPKP